MSIIDIVILVPLVLGAINGFKKGFVLEVASLLALILAVIGGFHFLHWGMAFLTEHFQLSGKFLPFAAFLLIFIGIVLLVNLVGKILSKVIRMAFLGSIDNIAGGLLGALKFVFFFSVLIWIFQVFGLVIPQHLQDESLLYPYVVAVAPATVDVFGFIIPATTDLMNNISTLLNPATP